MVDVYAVTKQVCIKIDKKTVVLNSVCKPAQPLSKKSILTSQTSEILSRHTTGKEKPKLKMLIY